MYSIIWTPQRHYTDFSGSVPDVGDVGLALDQHFCRAEIAQLDNVGVGVQQQVLRLYVSMADPQLGQRGVGYG
jgi:hypothetical protein